MKTQTGPVERRKFYELHQDGQTYEQISSLFGISAMCVRYWCRKQAQGEGVEDQYYNPRAGTLSQFDPRVALAIRRLRAAHPRWGAASIALHLSQEPDVPDLALPSRASIGRFLYEDPQNRRVPKKKSE